MYLALVALVTVSMIFGVANADSQTELFHIGNSLALEQTILNFILTMFFGRHNPAKGYP